MRFHTRPTPGDGSAARLTRQGTGGAPTLGLRRVTQLDFGGIVIGGALVLAVPSVARDKGLHRLPKLTSRCVASRQPDSLPLTASSQVGRGAAQVGNHPWLLERFPGG